MVKYLIKMLSMILKQTNTMIHGRRNWTQGARLADIKSPNQM